MSEVMAAPAARWQRRYTVVALCVAAVFVCYIDRVNISVAVIAMQEQFGWSDTVKGYVLSSFFIGYMLFMAPSGWLSNRYGGRLVLGVAVLWWSLFTMVTPFAAALSLPILILTRIGMGLGEAAMFPSAYTLYGRWVPPTERSRAVSLLIGGIPLGTLFALMTTGLLVENFGWPSVFYVFGLLGFLWVAIWFLNVADDPARDTRISEAERAMLVAAAPKFDQTEKVVPWRKIFASSAIRALIVNHFCSNWVLYMLLAWLPSYFKQAQGLSIVGAGVYSAAPWLAMFVMGTFSGWIADRMVRGGVRLTTVRKVMQVIGLLGSAGFLLAVIDVESPGRALALMCGALGAISFTWSGFVPNHLDIAPRHADVLMGITNTAGTIPGIVGVFVTGWLLDVTGTYTSAFVLAASVNCIGAIVWLRWATAEPVID